MRMQLAIGAVALALVIDYVPTAYAQMGELFVSEVGPDTIPSVRVYLQDDATGGCWTNLGEVETYTTDLLERRGYPVSGDASWVILISVSSERAPLGNCYGSVEFTLETFASADGVSGTLVAGGSSWIFTGHPNANVIVLDKVKELVSALPSASD